MSTGLVVWSIVLGCVCCPPASGAPLSALPLQVPEQPLKPCASDADISPRHVFQEPRSGVVLPRDGSCCHSGGTTTELLGEPLTSAAALSGPAPSWCDDMGDDILKMLIARARFYDKAIRYCS